jgi:hypothetical protein
MNIDALTFRDIAQAILPPAPAGTVLTAREAAAIVQLGYLASGADLEEDSDELVLRDQLGKHVCALAGISLESIPRPSPLPLPIDDEARSASLQKVCAELTTTGARELAYVNAYLLAIGDLELAPAETVFISELQQRLEIGDARASELVASAAARVTPMQAPSADSRT